MTPLFKTNLSFGKSILTIDPPKKDSTTIFGEDYKRSVLSLAKDLETVVLVEDALSSLKTTIAEFSSARKKMIFGLRMEIKTHADGEPSKIIVFANGCDGIASLRKVDSLRHGFENLQLDLSAPECDWLSRDLYWEGQSLKVAIPFYDSFVASNATGFSCIDINPHETVRFILENNGLPQDLVISRALSPFTQRNPSVSCKSIYYPSRDDFSAWLSYKIICNRKFGAKARSLSRPEESHCGSKEFCWESYLESCV